STAYSGTVTASGGTAPYTYVLAAGALPSGLSLNGASGNITGTPTAAGTYNFTIGAQDSLSNVGSASSSITIVAAATPISVTPATLPGGTVGAAYTATIGATG